MSKQSLWHLPGLNWLLANSIDGAMEMLHRKI